MASNRSAYPQEKRGNHEPLKPGLSPPRLTLMSRLRQSWRPLVLVALMGVACWLLASAAAQNYRWQWYRVWRYVGVWQNGAFLPGPLLYGLLTTLELTAAALGMAVLIGAALTLMNVSPSPSARLGASMFVGVARNTPLLIQLFAVYFVAAPVMGLNPFMAAALSLAAFEGAYMSEIFRAGIAGLPRSQWEAALSLGMSVPMAARLVIVPQALRQVLAPLISQIVSLIKDTSLVSAIAVADLTMRGRATIADTFLSLEIWVLVAAMYLTLTLLVSIPAAWLGKSPLTHS